MVRKGNHPAGRKICKFQICEIFLKYLDSIQQLWRWWWRQGAECVRLIIGGPYGARGVAVGAYPPEQSVIPCLELSKFLPRTPGPFVFFFWTCCNEKNTRQLDVWRVLTKDVENPPEADWMSVQFSRFGIFLTLFDHGCYGRLQTSSNKDTFPHLSPKEWTLLKKSKKRI